MKVLAVLRPRDGSDVRTAVAARAGGELHALWQLYREGTVREMYSPASFGAVLVLETTSLASARSTLEKLPLVADEVMRLELIELRPFVAFEMLFHDN